jgi:rod shape-determining protein MreC
MQHISVEPPAFFHRGPSPLSRLALLGLLSIALLFADTRFRYLEGVRQVVTVALYPFQRAVLLPGEAIAYVSDYFTSKRQLADENARLKEQLVTQAPAASSAALLEAENVRLKALLETARRYSHAAIAAEVLYMGRDPFSQKAFINKGVETGVKAGDAVIDERGVVGQVTRAYPMMSEVTLLTERDYAVPVKIERNGIRSLLFGNGTGRSPELRFTAPSADVKVGDRLVTSGIDGTYPAGLAVADVVDIDRETGARPRGGAAPTAGGAGRNRGGQEGPQGTPGMTR